MPAKPALSRPAPPAYTDPDLPPGAPRVATPSTWAPGPDRDEIASYTVTRGAETRSSGQVYDPTTGRLASMTIGGVLGSLTFSYAPRAGESVSDTGQLRHASMPQTRAGSSAVATTLYYDGPLGTETRTEGLPNAPWKVGYHHDAADELRLAHLTVAVGGESTDVPTIAYDYDADGLITSLGYGYDGDGIALREGSYDENVAPTPTLARSMAVVPDPQTGVLAHTCVGGTVALGSGTCSGRVSTTITPNDFGEPASVETTWNGSSVSGSLSFHYVHDRAGRIVARTEVEGASSTTLEYGYDAQGRLENVWRRTSPTTRERLYHYQYDANGNRIGWSLPTGTCNPTVSTCTRVDEQDRLLSAGGVSYRYDLQGQLATRTEGTRAETFTYDMAGNLRRVVVREGATQTRHVEYAIDAFGRRVGRYVGTSGATSPDRFWVYQDGLNPVAQLNAMGQLELLFLYGTQAHVPDLVVEVRGAGAADDLVYRVVTDQVGSVRRLVNVETGAVAASFDYSPFGVLEREDGALAARFPFRFAGGLWDGDTGLVRFGARDYDPRVGRWTAKDPILWDGGQGNLYEYVGGAPVKYIDPRGLWVVTAAFGQVTLGAGFGWTVEFGVYYGSKRNGAFDAGYYATWSRNVGPFASASYDVGLNVMATGHVEDLAGESIGISGEHHLFKGGSVAASVTRDPDPCGQRHLTVNMAAGTGMGGGKWVFTSTTATMSFNEVTSVNGTPFVPIPPSRTPLL